MTLQQLYYFCIVAELEHFTKAAEKLMVSQPSLSHAINDLESELGVHLFERQGRNVKLTKYGAIFLEYVVEALDILDHGRAKLNDFTHPDTGTVSLAYFSSLEGFIPYLVSSFYANTEHVKTHFQFQQLSNKQIEEGLVSGSMDLAFATRLDIPKLCFHKIGTHNLVLIVPVSHSLAQYDSMNLKDLANENFVTYDNQCQIRQDIDQVFQIAGVQPKILLEASHDTIISSYVAANYGLALVPEPLGNVRNDIKALRIENELPPREIYLVWKDVRYLSPAVKRFRDFIIKSGLVLDGFRKLLG